MDRISAKSTISGLAIGTLVLCANFQFGLQTGWVSMMSMPAALLGFAWFKTLRAALTPQENVYIQSVVIAVGTGPLSFGFVGALPAIQLLLTDEEGRAGLSWFQLIVWSLGVAYTGIFTAMLLRKYILADTTLKFPSGSAAAALISVLHKTQRNPSTTAPSNLSPHRSNASVWSQPGAIEIPVQEDSVTYRQNILALVTTFVISSIITILSKVVWFMHAIPLFGRKAAAYMWTFEFSPAYIGQGIIMGLPTTAAMMVGAVLGWACLVPLSANMGWAPGPIDDWKEGAQGWVMWISLAIMVADTTVSFFLLSAGSVVRLIKKPETEGLEEYENLEQETESVFYGTSGADRDDVNEMKIGTYGIIASAVLCVLCVKMLFDVPLLALLAAVIISPFLSLLGIRALGETDLNPVTSIAKLTQIVFGMVVRSRPDAVLLNIVAGAITEAGAQQAGDLMQDYKTGSLLGASAVSQTAGMAIGTTWSVLICGLVYKLYTSHFEIPGSEFRIPAAYIWADCARLMTGQGLPVMANPFVLVFGIIFAALAVVKHVYRDRTWTKWIPSGIAVGIGMYNDPSFTIARFIGGVIDQVYKKYRPGNEKYVVILSSGLILGEGLMSVVYMLATL